MALELSYNKLMVDAHCHLNFHSFEEDRDIVIQNAFKSGVTKIINAGTKIDSSKLSVELAQKYENLYAVIGVHPHHADKLEPDWLNKLEQLAKNPASNAANAKVVGIGEIGMDYFSYKSNDIVDPKLQKEVFIKQVELAHKLKLPLQIHNRQAGKDILEILLNYKSYLSNPPGMFHCFAGNMGLLKKVLDLGFYIGFDGNITYNGLAPGENTDLKDLAKYVPIDRLITETDAPFLAPIPKRGSRNMPEYVIITAKFIAELKGINFENFEAKTTENATKLFSL
jgi:TatD DNase family protein